MKRMSSSASALSCISRAIVSKRARSSRVARVAADRAISRSSSRRTSSIWSCFLTLNSETRTPRRGSTVTSPSRARRCSASRTGVRPMPSVSESAPSESTSPGSSCRVQIISSSATYARSVRLRSASLRCSTPEACSTSFKCGSSDCKRLGKTNTPVIEAADPGCVKTCMLVICQAYHKHAQQREGGCIRHANGPDGGRRTARNGTPPSASLRHLRRGWRAEADESTIGAVHAPASE